MKRIKYLAAYPLLRVLDATEVALARLSLKAHNAYLKIWNWTEV